MKKEIVEYLQNVQEHGFSLEEAKQRLLKQGWTQQEITEALDTLNPVNDTRPKQHKHWLLWIAGVLFLLVVAGLIFILFLG